MLMTIENDEKKLVYHAPYNILKLQHSIRTWNYIGTPRERMNKGYQRVYKTQVIYTRKSKEMHIEMELKRILANLHLSLDMWYDINLRFKRYYSQLKYATKNRGYKLLLPVAVYLHCLENIIFIPYNKMKEAFNCKKKDFYNCLKEVLKNNPTLFKKSKTVSFRKQMILQMLSGLKNEFAYPDDFLSLCIKYVSKWFETFKNKRNEVIAIIISYIVKEKYYKNEMIHCMNKASQFLGIESSVISKYSKLKNILQ